MYVGIPKDNPTLRTLAVTSLGHRKSGGLGGWKSMWRSKFGGGKELRKAAEEVRKGHLKLKAIGQCVVPAPSGVPSDPDLFGNELLLGSSAEQKHLKKARRGQAKHRLIREWETSPKPHVYGSTLVSLADEQIRRTLAECTAKVSVNDIIGYYGRLQCEKGSRKTGSATRGNLGSAQPQTRAWRITLDSQTISVAHEVVRDIFVYRSENPGNDTSWFNMLTHIVQQGKDASWWDDLPVFLVKLMRSDSASGASNAFLGVVALCRVQAGGEPAKAVSLSDLSKQFASTQARGDLRCM